MQFEQGPAGRLAQIVGAVRAVVLVSIVLALSAPSSRAQSPGQWWWVAEVGLANETRESTVGGSDAVRSDYDELVVSYGLRGFVLHPAVGRFGIDLDMLLSNFETRDSGSTDRYGIGGDLRLFPQGAVPSSFHYRRQTYDHGGSRFEGSSARVRVAEESSDWGAFARVRRGALRGTSINLAHQSVRYSDPTWRDEERDRQTISWLRGYDAGSHRVQLERRTQQYAFDVDMDDLTLRIDEQRNLGRLWRWDAHSDAVQRDLRSSGAESTTTTGALRTRFWRQVLGRDSLSLSALVGGTDLSGLPSQKRFGLTAEYDWRPRRGLEVSPHARYARETINGSDLEVPSVGVTANFMRTVGLFRYQLNGRTFYSDASRVVSGMSMNDQRLGYGLFATLGHGNGRGLSKELTVGAARDEVSLDRDPIFELPDLGLPGASLVTRDSVDVRASAAHRWDSSHLKGVLDWRREESDDDRPRTVEMLRWNLNVGIRAFDLHAQLGQTDVTEALNEQQVRYLTGALVWRPRRYLHFKASYRTDRRDVSVGPAVDGERIDLEVEFRLGSLRANLLAFRNVAEVEGSAPREFQGYRFMISSRLAGWLPVVSGTKTRGVIR